MVKLYKTFIRPHLEYASIVWDPHLVKDTQSLEQVQKFALRMCFRDWSCQYETLLNRARLPTLSTRRKHAKLCHIFKLIHGLTDCLVAPVHTRLLQGRYPIYHYKISEQTPHNSYILFILTLSVCGIHYHLVHK